MALNLSGLADEDVKFFCHAFLDLHYYIQLQRVVVRGRALIGFPDDGFLGKIFSTGNCLDTAGLFRGERLIRSLTACNCSGCAAKREVCATVGCQPIIGPITI